MRRFIKYIVIICIMAMGQQLFAQKPDLPNMAHIAGGEFYMGSPVGVHPNDQAPVRLIRISDFSMSTTPITVAQWRYYCEQINKKMPDEPKWGWKEDHPIFHITWTEAIEYTDWLSEQTGKIHRLPTEAEWEYVAKEGGKDIDGQTLYSSSNQLEEVGWYKGNSEGSTQPVAQKRPNKFGVYDLSGNVWEWCRDWYGWYPVQDTVNPVGNISGDFRVIRGGSWYNDPSLCTNTNRQKYLSLAKFDYLGFRVVCQ